MLISLWDSQLPFCPCARCASVLALADTVPCSWACRSDPSHAQCPVPLSFPWSPIGYLMVTFKRHSHPTASAVLAPGARLQEGQSSAATPSSSRAQHPCPLQPHPCPNGTQLVASLRNKAAPAPPATLPDHMQCPGEPDGPHPPLRGPHVPCTPTGKRDGHQSPGS